MVRGAFRQKLEVNNGDASPRHIFSLSLNSSEVGKRCYLHFTNETEYFGSTVFLESSSLTGLLGHYGSLIL